MTDQCFSARSFFAAAAAACAATGSPFSLPPMPPGYPDITDPRMANFIRERMLFGIPGSGNFPEIVGQFPVGHPFVSNQPPMLWPPSQPQTPTSSDGKSTVQQQQSSPSIEQLQQIYMQNPWYAAMLSGNNGRNIPPGSTPPGIAATQLAGNPQLWAAFAAAYGNGSNITAQQQQPPSVSIPTSNHHIGPIMNNKHIPSPDTFLKQIDTEKSSTSLSPPPSSIRMELSPDQKSIKQELDIAANCNNNDNINTTTIDVANNSPPSSSPKRSTNEAVA